ncbi:MAG TPA: thioredoxin-dependent thiol peroxidase [Chloroflexia bacterium]|nr:thioredoxin-dependent thiol peroxidase [Chloroflexia bacterium]
MSQTEELESHELKEGDHAPDFELPISGGEGEEGSFKLSDALGTSVILYFYPKDDTPGCTTEACEFRDNMDVLSETGALVYGISPDSVKSHDKFIAKHDLNFPLLADEGAKVATMYGVWKEKNMYGRKYMGVERTTFLINPDGTIGKIWHKVKPKGHAEEVLKTISEIR